MEIIIGGLVILGFIAYAVWRQRKDCDKHGEITGEDRKRTYISVLVWLFTLMVAFTIYVPAYIGVLVVFIIYSQIFGMGVGKRGYFRQIRDGGFIACIASMPICLILWNQSGQT